MSRIRKFLRRPRADRRLLLEALASLLAARLAVRALPFRWLARRLGAAMGESPAKLPAGARETARRIGWAVEAVARHAPLGFVCLPQAVAAKWMLRRRGLPSTLYLGLSAGSEGGSLQAHAWLRAGDRILTGRAGSVRHRRIASFG